VGRPVGDLKSHRMHSPAASRAERPGAFIDKENSHIKPRVLAELEDSEIEPSRHPVIRPIQAAVRREELLEVVSRCL